MSWNDEEQLAKRAREKTEREKQRKIEDLHRNIKSVEKLRSRAQSMHWLSQRLRYGYDRPTTGQGRGKNWSFWRKDAKKESSESVTLTPEEVEIFGEWLLENIKRLQDQADAIEARAAGVDGD